MVETYNFENAEVQKCVVRVENVKRRGFAFIVS